MSAWGYVSLLFILKYLFIYLAEPGLSHDVISLKFVLACRIFSCGMGTLSCIIWDLVPWPGWEPQALLWECRILATEPPGNSLTSYYIILLGKKISLLHIGGNNSTLNLYIPIPSFHNYEYFANLSLSVFLIFSFFGGEFGSESFISSEHPTDILIKASSILHGYLSDFLEGCLWKVFLILQQKFASSQ